MAAWASIAGAQVALFLASDYAITTEGGTSARRAKALIAQFDLASG
jgi:hypothetical protein